MSISKNIEVFSALGQDLAQILQNNTILEPLLVKTRVNNPWFIERFSRAALDYWAKALTKENIHQWLTPYDFNTSSQKVALILAGNIPMVGFHDVLCTLISGNQALIKLSEKDAVLIPFVLERLCEIDPSFAHQFSFVSAKMSGYDKVIATGSSNSSRYFEYYFNQVPHVIRKNRSSLAILTGDETMEDLHVLMDDLFMYFGLGCRNVSKLYLPVGYSFDLFYKACEKYEFLLDHKKYFNNYQYYKTIELLNQSPILDMGLCTLKPTQDLYSPISMINIEYYTHDHIPFDLESDAIQCVIGKGYIPFGKAQYPDLHEYADGVDTLAFLLSSKGEPSK